MVSWFFPEKRRAVLANLTRLNLWSGQRFKVDLVFENFGQTLADFLTQRPVSIRVEGREKAEEARRQGRGVIFLTSHLGNWELGGRILADWEWPVTAVYRPYQSPTMQNFIQRRRSPHLQYLAVGQGAAKGIVRVLERRETVAILGDRPFGEEGVPVSLCGGTILLPRGPFLFSCRYNVPLIPGFVFRARPGIYRAVVEDPLWPNGQGAQELMERLARILERYLALYGEQWYCFEPVWTPILSPGV
jgi:KDO2-lipid IV(A) lauroyltransferase